MVELGRMGRWIFLIVRIVQSFRVVDAVCGNIQTRERRTEQVVWEREMMRNSWAEMMRNSWAEQQDTRYFQEQGKGESRSDMRKPADNGGVNLVGWLCVEH